MRYYLDRQASRLKPQCFFPTVPTFYFRSAHTVCEKNHKLTVLKTGTKNIATLSAGNCVAHETVLHCGKCNKKYYSDELRRLIPARCYFGFDVIDYIGNELYIEKRSHADIRQSLQEKNIPISLREITYLGHKYITYLTIAHNESKDKIKSHLDYQGGYILHLDGTCEGDSPHLFSSMDELSNIVLHNVKMPTENKKFIIPFLEEIKASYGNPIAIISDMGKSILDAVRQVFPGVKHLICHFHFLRDIGKDLFQLEYRNIRQFLKDFKIRGELRKHIRELKSLIDKNDNLSQSLTGYLSQENLEELCGDLPSIVSAYILLTWVIEARAESNGYGFPFDRPHVDFFRRLQQAYPRLRELNVSLRQDESITLPISAIYKVLDDTALKNNIQTIEEKIIIFEKLRAAMRIAQVDKLNGLNDEGDTDINTIESEVKSFRGSEMIKQIETTDISYKKFVKQIDKYWKMLFADPIELILPNGKTKEILPQRTNNLMEQLFRFTKSDDRKKSGTKSVQKQIKSMHPQRPLIKNLNNPDYQRIILNGKANLAERFADIDAKIVQEEMKKEREVARKYHKGMGNVFKILRLPEKLFEKSAETRVAA